MTYSPTVPMGGAASYQLWPVFIYSNGYWEVYRRFQGDFFWFGGGIEGRGTIWEDLSLEEYVMGEDEFNENDAEFYNITIKKNNEKINMKKFFQLKVRSNIKT